MSIQPLAAATIRALNSGQVLTDPISLLKELLENSLDAGATQVTIETSANLLDHLTVKDNGFGISPADRPSTCKPHHTSKISSFDGISSVTTLGFRGEALASATDLSHHVLLTSRVKSERAGESWDASTPDRRRSVGAPVGTTIRVEGFLKRLPVRREAGLRTTKLLVKRLRALLATYYLSRPTCRFALRIAGADPLVYAPSKNVVEAMRRVAGREAVAAGQWVVREGGRGVVAEAFVMRSGAAPVEGPAYVFVDGRPVACTRGLMKELRQTYKAHVKAAAAPVASPLLYLNIRCPSGSYDPNVEPAKDDVLFDGNVHKEVVAAVEELFKGVYGELTGKERKGREKHSVTDGGFGVLLARKRDVVEEDPKTVGFEKEPAEKQDMGRRAGTSIEDRPVSDKEGEETMLPDNEAIELERKKGGTVPARRKVEPTFDDEELEMLLLDEAAIEAEREQIRKDVTLSNPWIVAKMNTPLSRSRDTASSPTRQRPQSTAVTGEGEDGILSVRQLPRESSFSPVRPPRRIAQHTSSFTPINPLYPRADNANSTFLRNPGAKPLYRGFGIPPFSPPSADAGSMDRFVTRIPKSPEQSNRRSPSPSPARKKRRLDGSGSGGGGHTQNPNRNRFLSATAALNDLSPPPPPLPRPLPPPLLRPSTTTTAPSSSTQGFIDNACTSPSSSAASTSTAAAAPPTRLKRRTRTLPAPPLLPMIVEYQTHALTLQLPAIPLSLWTALSRDRTGRQAYRSTSVDEGFCFGAGFRAEEVGRAVERWVRQHFTEGEDEGGAVRGWEMVEGPPGEMSVLRALS